MVFPSGLTTDTASRRREPASGVRLRRVRGAALSTVAGLPGSGSGPGSTAKSRGWAGPRSASQYRTGYSLCRMAATLLSLRLLRRSASASSSPEPARTDAVTKAALASLAAMTLSTPPALDSTTRASPPSAGRTQSALTGSPSVPAGSLSGSGRADVK